MKIQDVGIESRLIVALAITSFILVVELAGAALSNSLALLGDAGHVFTDTLALGLSALALRLSKKPHTQSMTYGYHRMEILAAFLNAGVLLVVSFYLFYEAYLRVLHPPEVKAPILLVTAIIGLAANVVTFILLRSGGKANLNIKAALLHVFSDALSSVGVIFGGALLLLTGAALIDPLVGAFVGALILKGAIDVSRESATILLEGAPSQIRLDYVRRDLLEVEGVRGVHDLHVWSITSGLYAITGHITVDDQMLSQADQVLGKATRILREKFSIMHVTLQLEAQPLIPLGSEEKR